MFEALVITLREGVEAALVLAIAAGILRDLDIVHVRRDGKSQRYTLNEAAFGFCSPRVCQAWKSALGPGPAAAASPLVRPGER